MGQKRRRNHRLEVSLKKVMLLVLKTNQKRRRKSQRNRNQPEVLKKNKCHHHHHHHTHTTNDDDKYDTRNLKDMPSLCERQRRECTACRRLSRRIADCNL